MKNLTKTRDWLSLLSLALIPAMGMAQEKKDAAQPPTAPEAEEEVLTLSPFEVSGGDTKNGYEATSTLGGSRIKTDLRDVASVISIVTPQYLKDTGSKNSQDLLVYTANTEVAGTGGNFGGLGNGTNVNENRSLVSPNNNTRVRGLDEADNTRDYFLTDIPWDSYNVDRVELQRGPNSILFGVGSPAGIINTATIVANFSDKGKVENRIGSYGSIRWSLDFNKVLVKDLLALRFAALDDTTKFQQKPAYQRDRRAFAAAVFKPQVFDKAIASPLTVRASYEQGEGRSNRPRYLPPIDRLTPFFGELNKKTFDPYGATYGVQRLAAGNPANRQTLSDNSYGVPWLAANFGGTYDDSMLLSYINGNALPSTSRVKQIRGPGVDKFGNPDGGIDGTYAELNSIAGFNEYAKNVDYLDTSAQAASRFPAAQKDFWKDKTLADATIFDFYNNLYDGSNKREWRDFKSYNVSASQTFWDNRVGIEGVYDYQDHTEGASGATFGGTPFVSIDINKTTIRKIPNYALKQNGFIDLESSANGDLNPYVGQAYFAGTSPSAYSTRRERENLRATAFGEFRANDVFDKESTLAKILGRQRVTGLLSSDERRQADRQWLPYALSTDWIKYTQNPTYNLGSSGRSLATVVYTSARVNGQNITDLRTQNTAAGLHLDPLRSIISPGSGISGEYFDRTWNAPSTVGYGDLYLQPFPNANNPANTAYNSTQSENLANFKGWTSVPMPILNADAGDIDQLTFSASKGYERIKSEGLTWQGFFFNDNIVPTYGWRKDSVKSYGVSGARDSLTSVTSTNIDLRDNGGATRSEGQTRSWGIVAHLPRSISKHLPLGTTASAFYNHSSNFRAVNRYGFDTKALPNPTGKSVDYGVVLRTLDDRLTLKVTKFKTTVENATLPGDPYSSALGSKTYILNEIEGRGAGNVAVNIRGDQGLDDSEFWFWNWKWVGTGFGNDGTVRDAAYFAHPETVKKYKAMDAFVAGMPSQEWYNAFGYDLDVAAFKAAYAAKDGVAIIKAFNHGAWAGTQGTLATISSQSGGKINNQSYPLGTISQESEGYEFEVNAKPTQNWNIAINASKVSSSRGQLGSSITNWIESQYSRWQGDAGDLRLWWAGDPGIRKMYNDGVYASYLFQKGAAGTQAPEIRPWRFNTVTNYSFDHGFLKGTNVGLGYRWQDRQILGYQLNAALDNLDPKKPLYGKSETAVDFWIGYSRKATKQIDWNIQLNIRNAGQKARLIPISVQPDGTPAASRIAEGSRWELTNTFSF